MNFTRKKSVLMVFAIFFIVLESFSGCNSPLAGKSGPFVITNTTDQTVYVAITQNGERSVHTLEMGESYELPLYYYTPSYQAVQSESSTDIDDRFSFTRGVDYFETLITPSTELGN